MTTAPLASPPAAADWDRWRRRLRGHRLPAAVLDLEAVDHNLATLLAQLAPGPTLRLASKSLRLPWLMRYLQDHAPARLQGLMTFSAHETAWLATQGFTDLLLAYPVARPDEAHALATAAASGARVLATVDAPEHVALLAAAARAADARLAVCLDVDASWRPLGGLAHFGVRRSPLRAPADALRLARLVADAPHLTLTAVLAYEAQVAGLPDVHPHSRPLDPVRRAIKARSRPLAAARRRAIVDALRAAGHPVTLVNGGGTGSIASTSRDGSVTEVTAGSGFVAPHLFDHYQGLPLHPALFFALPVARASDPDHLTCSGGGYIASGAPGPDRAPVVHLPPGLHPLPMEGFGEVQTPFRRTSAAPTLAIGDPVLCRHAKAGELAERFAEVLCFRGDTLVHRAPTYRGHGQTFF